VLIVQSRPRIKNQKTRLVGRREEKRDILVHLSIDVLFDNALLSNFYCFYDQEWWWWWWRVCVCVFVCESVSAWVKDILRKMSKIGERRCSVRHNISLMKQQFIITHRHTILQQTEKAWPILNRPALKHVVFLRNTRTSNLFADTTLWQKESLWPSCLMIRESQFDGLCGLRHIAVSWEIY
jgi:hypothetical protein